MQVVTVSEKGQVVIPVEIRRRLGITPGCQLAFDMEGSVIRVRMKRRMVPTRVEDGYGLLRCKEPGERRLADFDVAEAMQKDER